MVLRIGALVLVVLVINASIPHLSWLLGFRFFGTFRGLLLMSHFGGGFMPDEENPFRKFDQHNRIFTAAVASAVVLLFLLVFIFNRLR